MRLILQGVVVEEVLQRADGDPVVFGCPASLVRRVLH
jgi:hypothetical protein